jgi:uncharacterized protein
MKKILLAFFILLLVVVGIYFVLNYSKGIKPGVKGAKTEITPTSTVTIDGHSFKVAVATSQQEQEIGLSKTNSISQDQGMIFLFNRPDYYSFWMKNMKFAIDIIYINQDTIVTIKDSVQPPKNSSDNLIIYTPTEPSDKVLEITAGLSKKYKFRNGDKVKYENLGN